MVLQNYVNIFKTCKTLLSHDKVQGWVEITKEPKNDLALKK